MTHATRPYRSTTCRGRELTLDHIHTFLTTQEVGPGGPVVIILATGSEVRGFKPGRDRGIFPERKTPEYDSLRKGSTAIGPVS